MFRMTRVKVAAVLFAGAMVVFAHGLRASQTGDFASLENEAALALSPENEFSRRADLATRLHAASERASDPEQRARLALLWLRIQRSLIAMLPFEGPPVSPYREWLAQQKNAVADREIGGWVLLPEFLWHVHDRHKSTEAAEELAWFITETGLPSDCEGHIPCYTRVMNSVAGEFLRRYPRGVHASEAVAGVQSSIAQLIETLSEPYAKDFLDPSSSADCEQLKQSVRPLRQAIAGSNANNRVATLTVIDTLLKRCP